MVKGGVGEQFANSTTEIARQRLIWNDMLKFEKLETGYGKKQVLFGINLEAPERKITAIIGPNGSGKSTALKAIFGLIPVWNGNVIYNGEPITNRGTRANVRDGIGFVPQGNRVFDEMTVLENLEIGGLHLAKNRFKEKLRKIWELFPELEKWGGYGDVGKKVTKPYSINCNPFSRAMVSPLSTENPTPGELISNRLASSLRDRNGDRQIILIVSGGKTQRKKLCAEIYPRSARTCPTKHPHAQHDPHCCEHETDYLCRPLGHSYALPFSGFHRRICL